MRKRRATSVVHVLAGLLAFAVIISFVSSTLAVEAFGGPAAIALIKKSIAWGLLILVPALVATAGSGVSMVSLRPKGLSAAKLARMRIIAANGILVLVPSALFLAWRAGSGEFDVAFIVVQAIELVAGSANLAIMGLNIRDGLRMKGRIAYPSSGRAARASPVPAAIRAIR